MIVVVEPLVTVVSCAKTETARVTASVAKAAKKRILMRNRMNECIEGGPSRIAMGRSEFVELSGEMVYTR